jgi:hypothetical protein
LSENLYVVASGKWEEGSREAFPPITGNIENATLSICFIFVP